MTCFLVKSQMGSDYKLKLSPSELFLHHCKLANGFEISDQTDFSKHQSEMVHHIAHTLKKLMQINLFLKCTFVRRFLRNLDEKAAKDFHTVSLKYTYIRLLLLVC